MKGRWTYLYRAVDSRGQTIDFLLSAKRDAAAAQRFFRKALGQPHTGNPRTITVDKNAAYPAAVTAMKRDGELWRFSRLCPVKYLNTIVEQDHRRIKRLVRPGLGFGSLPTARRTLAGCEGMAMIRKGQVRSIGGGDMRASVTGLVVSIPREPILPLGSCFCPQSARGRCLIGSDEDQSANLRTRSRRTAAPAFAA